MERDINIFDNYFEASYKQANILTEEQYKKAYKNFENIYRNFIPKNKNASILDIGCGTGHFLYFIKEKGYTNYLGIDLVKKQLQICKEKGIKNVEYADAIDFLKNKENFYDLISAHDFLEHIEKEKIIIFLRLVYFSLKKEGKLFLRVPNMSNPFSLDSRYSDFTHEIGFTGKSLYQVLWTCGFRDIIIQKSIKIHVKTIKNLFRKILLLLVHNMIKLAYYTQGFTVPKNLDKNLSAIATKK